MRTFTSLLLILICFSLSVFASEFKFIASDNKSATKICMAAATDNTEVMISKLRMLSRRGTALSYRSFINSMQCNNQYIGNFAKTYNAQNTFDYLNQYTNKTNKHRQTNITIKDLVYENTINKEKIIVVLVAGN